MKSHCIFLVVAISLLPGLLLAQGTFPLRLERTGANGVCDNMTANRMSVDPGTGRVTLEGVSNLTCLPDGAAGLGNVNISVPAGPHASGATNVTATVSGIPAGASCTMRGSTNVAGSGLIGGQGWPDNISLCTSCGTSASRSLTLTNVSTTVQWRLRLQVQCSIASGGYSVLAPIVSSNEIVVQTATVAIGSCPFGEQVPPTNHDGLTIASRQTSATFTMGTSLGVRDVTSYVSILGAHPGDVTLFGRFLPFPGSVAEGFGYPGNTGLQNQMQLERGKFVAMKFRAPQVSATPWVGVRVPLQRFVPASPGTSSVFSISPCPGQFRAVPEVPLPAACVVRPDTKTGIDAVIVSASGSGYAGMSCPIKAGETYYLNIIAADPAGNLTQSLCEGTSSYCNVRFAKPNLSIEF